MKRINNPDFVIDDPISIPRQFERQQDIEISAFWIAMLSWGQRKTIIAKGKALFDLMDNAPHDFILNHTEKDRKIFEDFKHRTFNYTDTLYFLEFFQNYYRHNDTLENAFLQGENMKDRIANFHDAFFQHDHAPARTRKHVATPARNSACKRINMFLRWMVRKDTHGVDFGIWKHIKPSVLMMPLDVHVERVARSLGLLERKQRDWKAVEELTGNLRSFDPEDPVKYDYALYGLGVIGEL